MFINNSSSKSNLCSSFVPFKKLEKVNKPFEEEESLYLKKADKYFTVVPKIPKKYRMLSKYKIIK